MTIKSNSHETMGDHSEMFHGTMPSKEPLSMTLSNSNHHHKTSTLPSIQLLEYKTPHIQLGGKKKKKIMVTHNTKIWGAINSWKQENFNFKGRLGI